MSSAFSWSRSRFLKCHGLSIILQNTCCWVSLYPSWYLLFGALHDTIKSGMQKTSAT